MNAWLRPVIVAPMTTTMRNYPSRVNLAFARKKGQVALDQIRTIDKSRFVRKPGRLDDATGNEVATILTEMCVIGGSATPFCKATSSQSAPARCECTALATAGSGKRAAASPYDGVIRFNAGQSAIVAALQAMGAGSPQHRNLLEPPGAYGLVVPLVSVGAPEKRG